MQTATGLIHTSEIKILFYLLSISLVLIFVNVKTVIMLMLLLEQSRGRPTWPLLATWRPRAPRWWPLLQTHSLAYGGEACAMASQALKTKKCINSIRQWRNYEGQGPQFKIYWLCFLVTDVRTTQFFYDYCTFPLLDFHFTILLCHLTKLLHTWLLSNLTQVTLNTRTKLRLAWDFSPQTSISIFDKRYMSKTYNIQARI